jgi:hypothetical protein
MSEFPVSPADVWLRRELLAEGLTDRAIRQRVREGALVRLRHGAYVDAQLVAGLDRVGMLRARARAVLRTAHPSSVLTHQSAMAEHELPLWGVDLDDVHLGRTDSRPGRREAGIVHHRASLDETGWDVRGGVPVVHPARAAIEMATAYGTEVGLVAMCGVLHRELASIDQLRAVADEAKRWPGNLTTRLVLARADARLTNVAEARTWHLFHEQRVPRPEPQVEVFDEHGNLLGIVDFLWEVLGVFLEFDGRVKYDQHRLPGESVDDYVLREKRRAEQICVVKGWICIRITWADLQRPAVLGKRIRNALESRAKAA